MGEGRQRRIQAAPRVWGGLRILKNFLGREIRQAQTHKDLVFSLIGGSQKVDLRNRSRGLTEVGKEMGSKREGLATRFKVSRRSSSVPCTHSR